MIELVPLDEDGTIRYGGRSSERVYYDSDWAREAFDVFYPRSDDHFGAVEDLAALCTSTRCGSSCSATRRR